MPHRRRVAVAATALAVGVGVVAVVAPSPGGRGATGSVVGGGGSCVEEYSPEAVAGRAFAVDGTVRVIGASATFDVERRVTVEVHRWFSGEAALATGSTTPPGGPEQVLVDLPAPGATGSDGGLDYAVGDRLLISGEVRDGAGVPRGPVAWGCGFTRPSDPSTARAWADALAAQAP